MGQSHTWRLYLSRACIFYKLQEDHHLSDDYVSGGGGALLDACRAFRVSLDTRSLIVIESRSRLHPSSALMDSTLFPRRLGMKSWPRVGAEDIVSISKNIFYTRKCGARQKSHLVSANALSNDSLKSNASTTSWPSQEETFLRKKWWKSSVPDVGLRPMTSAQS